VTPSQKKRIERQEKFRKIHEALRDYYSGMESQFEIKGKAVRDPKFSSGFEGPKMKTQQWERTAKE
jgi:hypothetical protein